MEFYFKILSAECVNGKIMKNRKMFESVRTDMYNHGRLLHSLQKYQSLSGWQKQEKQYKISIKYWLVIIFNTINNNSHEQE